MYIYIYIAGVLRLYKLYTSSFVIDEHLCSVNILVACCLPTHVVYGHSGVNAVVWCAGSNLCTSALLDTDLMPCCWPGRLTLLISFVLKGFSYNDQIEQLFIVMVYCMYSRHVTFIVNFLLLISLFLLQHTFQRHDIPGSLFVLKVPSNPNQ